MNWKNKNKTQITGSLLILVTAIALLTKVSAQKPWFEGNLKGLDRFHVEASATGLESHFTAEEVKTFVESKLIQHHLKVTREATYPKLKIVMEAGDLLQDSTRYFLVECSVFDFTATMDQYVDSYTYSDLAKEFQTTKVYENQSIGSTHDKNLKNVIEQFIIQETERFLKHWHKDNPFKQF